MHVHIALFHWKETATTEEIDRALTMIESLQSTIPGIVEIACRSNESAYAEGYTHVVLVRGESQAAIDAYRAHPDHAIAARQIEAMEEKGIGVDFEA